MSQPQPRLRTQNANPSYGKDVCDPLMAAEVDTAKKSTITAPLSTGRSKQWPASSLNFALLLLLLILVFNIAIFQYNVMFSEASNDCNSLTSAKEAALDREQWQPKTNQEELKKLVQQFQKESQASQQELQGILQGLLRHNSEKKQEHQSHQGQDLQEREDPMALVLKKMNVLESKFSKLWLSESSKGLTSVTAFSPSKKIKDPSPPSQTENPGILFTSCCWCFQNQTWPECQNTGLSRDIKSLRSKGINARWIQMPCLKERKSPDIDSPEYSEYSLVLQEAHAKGDTIATTLEGRIYHTLNGGGLRRCCLDAESANVWVEHALSGGNQTHVDNVMQLQNKSSLHTVFQSAGLPHRVPKKYSDQEVRAGNISYPVFVKNTRGVFGTGVYPVQNSTVMKKLLKKIKNTDLIVEEALLGDRPYTHHYISRQTKNGIQISFWCSVYIKEVWNHTGIFVQGAGDANPKPTQIQCNKKDMEAVKKIFESINLKQGLGCVNGKDTNGPGTMKIFDWNVRMCGSLTGDIISDLFNSRNPSSNHLTLVL